MPPTLTKIDQVAGRITFHFALARGEAQNDGKFSGGVLFKLGFFGLKALQTGKSHSTQCSASTETERKEDYKYRGAVIPACSVLQIYAL